jgi:hypothetical protein
MHYLKKLKALCPGDPVESELKMRAAKEAQEFHSLMQHIPEKNREEVCRIVTALARESAYCSRNEALADLIRVADLSVQPRSADELMAIANELAEPITTPRHKLMHKVTDVSLVSSGGQPFKVIKPPDNRTKRDKPIEQ